MTVGSSKQWAANVSLSSSDKAAATGEPPESLQQSVGAVVLAGGLARRMEGRDKGLITLLGKPMVQWALEIVCPQVKIAVINANRNLDGYAEVGAALGAEVIEDSHPGHLGPLAGLSAALQYLDTDYVFMCPCDSPFLPNDMVLRLLNAAHSADATVAVARDAERLQPVFLLVRRSCKTSLDAFLESGERKIDRWFAQERLVEVDFSDQPEAFRNINTEEERLAVEQLWQSKNMTTDKPSSTDTALSAESSLLNSSQSSTVANELLMVNEIDQAPSCADPSDPGLLPVELALERIDGVLPKMTSCEEVGLNDALGRILATDIQSTIDVPSYTNSAMDGYAILSSDIPTVGVAELKVVGTAWAGRPLLASVGKGEAARIMTGAMMPPGTDTVVIQEHTQVLDVAQGATSDTSVLIDFKTQALKNVRQAGEDVKIGETVMHRGEWLGPAQLGQLASMGIAVVNVTKKLRVAFFTTGDELRSLGDHAGKELGPGELFDSNRYTLFGMLTRLGVEIIDLGVVRDNPQDTREAFIQASKQADVVITSGGVSAGEADFVTRIVHEMGEVAFWKLAMRPGRPLAFGKIGDSVFFGLPGNPVAVMVTFYEFVQPALKKMMGCRNTESTLVSARCLSDLRKSPGRTEYQRGHLSLDDQGEMTVETTGKQGAGRLSSMCVANCMIVLPPGADSIKSGERVNVQPFFGLV